MSEIYTDDDLILYIYNEAPAARKLALNEALSSDSSLRARYQQMCQVLRQMDSLMREPSADVVDQILERTSGQPHYLHP